MGMFICKNLVELMGGTISLTSKKNEGTRISFTAKCTVVCMYVYVRKRGGHRSSIRWPNRTFFRG